MAIPTSEWTHIESGAACPINNSADSQNQLHQWPDRTFYALEAPPIRPLLCLIPLKTASGRSFSRHVRSVSGVCFGSKNHIACQPAIVCLFVAEIIEHVLKNNLTHIAGRTGHTCPEEGGGGNPLATQFEQSDSKHISGHFSLPHSIRWWEDFKALNWEMFGLWPLTWPWDCYWQKNIVILWSRTADFEALKLRKNQSGSAHSERYKNN